VRLSEAWFLLAAVALHAGFRVLGEFAPEPEPEPPGVPIEVAVEVDVTESRPPTVVEAPAVRAEAPRNIEPAPAPRTERAPSAVQVEPGPVSTVAPSVEPQATGAPEAPAAPTGTSEYGGPPPAVPVVAGGGLPGLGGPAWTIPGAVPDMGRPPPAPTTLPAPTVDKQAATRVLKEAIKENDKKLGLDLPAGGTVATSVRAAVQATDTPPESRATFEVRLSPTGQVLSVRVTSSTGGTADMWARAAAAVKAALAGRTLTMTSEYSKGAVVTVSAQSLLTMPDGSKSVIRQQGAGATFDVANIGAHMQRVVRTSFSVAPVK
jgi:hypothetical protein